jgi:hypothetical protein
MSWLSKPPLGEPPSAHHSCPRRCPTSPSRRWQRAALRRARLVHDPRLAHLRARATCELAQRRPLIAEWIGWARRRAWSWARSVASAGTEQLDVRRRPPPAHPPARRRARAAHRPRRGDPRAAGALGDARGPRVRPGRALRPGRGRCPHAAGLRRHRPRRVGAEPRRGHLGQGLVQRAGGPADRHLSPCAWASARLAPGWSWRRPEQRARRALTDEAALRIATGQLFSEVRALATVEERRRLAREIHDGVAQEVAALGFVVDDLTARTTDAEAKEELGPARELTRIVSECGCRSSTCAATSSRRRAWVPRSPATSARWARARASPSTSCSTSRRTASPSRPRPSCCAWRRRPSPTPVATRAPATSGSPAGSTRPGRSCASPTTARDSERRAAPPSAWRSCASAQPGWGPASPSASAWEAAPSSRSPSARAAGAAPARHRPSQHRNPARVA